MKSEYCNNQRRVSRCHSCFLELPQCICLSRSTININQKCVSYDAFLVFTSLLITYWLFVKKFNNFFLPLPIISSYLMIKFKLFSPNNSILVSFTLKVCRFFVCHYKLILMMLLLSALSSFLNIKFAILLFVLILVYIFAKFANKTSDTAKPQELTTYSETNTEEPKKSSIYITNDRFVDFKMK
ncbi:hypothetical protein BpHYR1_009315 [Brachionus plicatilis]|uniref:Uncharacterized protein n=1 Tax=Brachionus plicatilis TaxID=10195 RepID=A0A3M7T063_BRAPC|nr:hypothetical protein BpHYR1_009315 [Brachionus plicatilis]